MPQLRAEAEMGDRVIARAYFHSRDEPGCSAPLFAITRCRLDRLGQQFHSTAEWAAAGVEPTGYAVYYRPHTRPLCSGAACIRASAPCGGASQRNTRANCRCFQSHIEALGTGCAETLQRRHPGREADLQPPGVVLANRHA